MQTTAAPPPYTLFGTSACHLCELAEDMLVTLGETDDGFVFEKVDISTSDALFERYGMTIPVLQSPEGGELGWPFSAAQLAAFVRRGCSE